jgi:predicted N-acyltransferase
MALQFEFINDIRRISKDSWCQLETADYPFAKYEFLFALEQSEVVSPKTGWQPYHLTIHQDDKLVGVMPLYLKSHSYGEYVFDWAWADAYQQHGLDYYPKLIAAIPFTPATGPRLLLTNTLDSKEILPELTETLTSLHTSIRCSSIHVLFPEPDMSEQLVQFNLLQRRSVQFHWYNKGFANFDEFLQTFTSRKRKNVKKERNALQNQDIQCQRLTGDQISQAAMEHFYQCYQHTYLKRSGHSGYLNMAFFDSLLATMQDQLMLVIASRGEDKIAAALYLHGGNTLYGRYWGALEEVNGLHFECCYYQGIEYSIEQHLTTFNPGTQGEHKIQRGFEPTYCYSNHFLAHPDFHNAVGNFLEEEKRPTEHYFQDASGYLPFKQEEQ